MQSVSEESAIIEAYREDVDLQRLDMEKYTYGVFARLRRSLADIRSRVVRNTQVYSPGSFNPNYLRGLNAAEADLEVIAIQDRCRPTRAVKRAEDYLREQIDNGRIASVFGLYPEAQQGFIEGYRAALAAASMVSHRRDDLVM